MTSAHQVRMALVNSPRWTELLKAIPILTLAAHSIMRPEDWSDGDRAHAVAWARGDMPIPPAPLSNWISSVLAKPTDAAPH